MLVSFTTLVLDIYSSLIRYLFCSNGVKHRWHGTQHNDTGHYGRALLCWVSWHHYMCSYIIQNSQSGVVKLHNNESRPTSPRSRFAVPTFHLETVSLMRFTSERPSEDLEVRPPGLNGEQRINDFKPKRQTMFAKTYKKKSFWRQYIKKQLISKT